LGERHVSGIPGPDICRKWAPRGGSITEN
jgi:hypothetical protein